MALDGREYLEWNNERGNSGDRLNRIPHITTTLVNGKRYYSTVDAELFFGNIYIDEVTEIQWTLNQNTLPLFGYNSYCFDDIALGTRLIQGQFAINYTKANYLGLLQESSGFNEIARRQYGKDFAETSYYSDYRKRLNLPKWDKGFDIVIGYGYHQTEIGKVKESETSSFAVLDCCQITGCSQGISYEGQPVQEIYTFIARDIKYTQATDIEKDPADNNGTDGDTSGPTTGSNITIQGEIDFKKKEIAIFTNDNAEFKGEGKITITYPFKDKTLNVEMSLSAKGSSTYCSISEPMKNAIMKEIEGKNLNKLPAEYWVKMGMISGDDSASFESDGNIQLFIV